MYRHHATCLDNSYIKVKYNLKKDLSLLGRDLNKIIIIDNVAENFRLQKDNGLNIKNFEGDENDNELIELMDDLKYIVVNKLNDVRKHLISIREKMNMRYKKFDEFSFDEKN